jgi:hypothetical protein
MTPRKILGRLCSFAPPIIAADPAVQQHARCVLACAIGGDVLSAFDIPWVPLPVHATLANAAYIAALARGAEPAVAVARGGHYMTTRDAPAGPREWAGHLVLWVPSLHVIADLDLRQFERPARGIRPPRPADVFPWRPEARGLEYTLPGGEVLRYDCTEDRRFEASPDWCRRERRAPLVAAVCRAVRAGHL